MRRIALSVLPLVLIAASVQAQVADPAPIVAAERAFAADFPEMGLAGSFQHWAQSDAVLISAGQARQVAKVFEGAPRTRQPGEPLLEWWPTFAGVAMSGEMGFTTGPTTRDAKGSGHYFTVWQRQADGQWRWIYDGGTNASPIGQPGRDSEPRILPVATVGSASAQAAMSELRDVEASLAVQAAADQKAAHLAVLAPEGRLYVAPLSPAEGPQAFATALEGWPAQFTFGPLEGGNASAGGDMAWTYGTAAWTQDSRSRTGHYVRLWQKRPQGWTLIVAQLIPAPNAPPPPAAG